MTQTNSKIEKLIVKHPMYDHKGHDHYEWQYNIQDRERFDNDEQFLKKLNNSYYTNLNDCKGWSDKDASEEVEKHTIKTGLTK